MSGDDVTDLKLGVLGDSEWLRRWREGESHWHRDETDPYLLENGAAIFGDEKKRIFLPLCGKSQDLIWLYRQGHTVVGVELAEQAIVELLEENSIAHSVEDLKDMGKVFKSKDERLTIFKANLFHVQAEAFGKFNVIWDSKSFTAINLDDRIRYRDMVYAIMKPDCLYYLKTLHYDETVWPGPPHSVSGQMVEETFGDACKIEVIEEIQSGGPVAGKAEETGADEKQVTKADIVIEATKTTDTSSEIKNSDKSLPALEETAKLTDTKNEQPDSSKIEQPKKLSPAQAAIKNSSFRFDRWYKLILKEPTKL